jgi:hypothetical protein
MSYLSATMPLLSVSGNAAPVAIANAFIADSASRLQTIRRDVRAWQRDIETITENLRNDIQTFRTSVDVPPWDNLDESIDLAERLEQAIAADHDSIGRLADELFARAKTLPPPARHLTEEIAKTAINVHADYAEALRDARWELMARRAEREPLSEADPAGTLDTYLDDLLRA